MANVQTAAATVPSGPPFTPPWSRFRNPPTDPAGFWSAVRHDAMVGGLVLQLGTQAHGANAPATSGSMYIGYQWVGYLPAGVPNITVRFHLGSVSVRPNGGSVSTLLVAQLFGPQGQFADVVQPPAYPNESWWVLRVTSPVALQAGQYTLRFGAGLVSQYQGSATPYGEIIVKDSSVTYQSLRAPGVESVSELPGSLSDETAFLVEQVSEQDAARERLALLGV